MKITTNNHVRPTIEAHELSPADRKRFDYLDWPGIDEGRDSATFFRYRGELYDLGNFERIEPGPDSPMAGWHGGYGDSYFSGTLVRLAERWDGPGVVVASYYA